MPDYALAVTCPVLASRMLALVCTAKNKNARCCICVRDCYAMSRICLRACHAMSGTAYVRTKPGIVWYSQAA
eukprot:942530-Rhodomonas_salina.3